MEEGKKTTSSISKKEVRLIVEEISRKSNKKLLKTEWPSKLSEIKGQPVFTCAGSK